MTRWTRSAIFPSRTATMPTEQALSRHWSAVSKSMATKFIVTRYGVFFGFTARLRLDRAAAGFPAA